MSFGQYFPAGRNSNNPIGSLTSPSNSNRVSFPTYEFSFKNPHNSYYALNYVDILSSGQNYPYSTTPYISAPDHTDGSQCYATISFGLTNDSLIVTDGGLDHEVGDSYFIYNSEQNNDPAILLIDEVDNDGRILSYTLSSFGSGFNNDGIFIDQNTVGSNEQATFTFVPDKFCISNINITDGGSGYDYFDEDGIVQNRRIIMSNSGGGFGFLGYITTEPQFINNVYKFPPKTHYSQNSINISNYSIQNSSSSSSLYSYVLTNCDNPLLQYSIINTPVQLTLYKQYRLNTYINDYPQSLNTCYTVEVYDENGFYNPLDSIIIVSGAYNSCEYCSAPQPTPTLSPPTPTPTPYNLSSSSSSSEQCSEAESPYARYTLAAILSGAAGYLSYRGMYKFLDRYLPQEDSLPPIQADPDKILMGKLQRDIRNTFRSIIFGEQPIPQSPRTTQIFYLDPIEPYGPVLLYERTALSLPLKSITFAPLDPNIYPLNKNNRPIINTLKFSIPSDANNISRDTFTIDTQDRPLFIPEDRLDLETQAEKLVKNVQAHNKSNPMAIINRNSGTEFLQQNGIKSFKDFRKFHINKFIERWSADPDFKAYIIKNPGIMDDIYDFVKLCIDKEIKLALSYRDQFFSPWLMTDSWADFQNGSSFQINGGDFYFRTLVYRQNLKRMRQNLAPWYYDNISKLLVDHIQKEIKQHVPPKPSLSQSLIQKVKSIKPPKVNFFGCKTKPTGAPKIPSGKFKGAGLLGLLELASTSAAVVDAATNAETTSDSIWAVISTLVRNAVPDLNPPPKLQNFMVDRKSYIGPLECGTIDPDFESETYQTRGFNTKEACYKFLNDIFKPVLADIYYRYYIEEITKEEVIYQISDIINKVPELGKLYVLDLNLYNHPDNFDPPKNGHKYWPYIQSDAIEIKQIFEQLLDPNALDDLVTEAVDEAIDDLTSYGGLPEVLYALGLTGYNKRYAIEKRRQAIKLIRKGKALEYALAPIVKATEDYLASLDTPTSETEPNCDYLCYPKSFDDISSLLDPDTKNDPLVWIVLKPKEDEQTKQILIPIQELEQALDEFEKKYYGE